METHHDVLVPFGEILLDQDVCSHEQVKEALHLQYLRRLSAIRRPLSSIFDPVNVMELLVEESIDELIHQEKVVTAINVVLISSQFLSMVLHHGISAIMFI